jgi:hypothetical protein
MKKLFGFSLFLLVVVAAGVYLALHFFLGSVVKTGVNKFGPGITQTTVELQGATLSPWSGEGTLNGLAVGNPQGWSQGDALRLGKIHINMEPTSVFKDHIMINELVVEQPEFFYETRLVASNIGDLLRNIEQSVGSSRGEVKTTDGTPVKMAIRKLVLQDGKVTVSAGTAVFSVPLPPIDMTDIGTAEGGLTPPQVAAAVMSHVTKNIVTAAAGAIAQGGAAGAGTAETAKQVGEAIKGLFGGRKQETTTPPPAPPPPQRK